MNFFSISNFISLVTAARQMIFTTPIRCASASSTGNQGNGDQSSGRAPLKKPFTPVGKHDDHMPEKHRDAEKQALEAFPDDVNPETGEKGGPRGPEPTRYGDWERKGRCIDFWWNNERLKIQEPSGFGGKRQCWLGKRIQITDGKQPHGDWKTRLKHGFVIMKEKKNEGTNLTR